LYLIR